MSNYSVCINCRKDIPDNSEELLFCSRSCNPAVRRANKRRQRETRKAKGLRAGRQQQHGMSDTEWLAFIADQRCHACGTAEAGARGFHVDHDHACCSGTFGCKDCVRGLLCHGCNVALGLLGDDPDRLLDLYAYMKRAQTGLSRKPQEALNG